MDLVGVFLLLLSSHMMLAPTAIAESVEIVSLMLYFYSR
jgi:hypothetical protein